MKISCVLISREKEYPQKVLDRLKTGFFDEIIIKTESPSVYQRYLAAKEAKFDVIYVQDDDCFVNYQELYNHYNGQITNVMTPHHQAQYETKGATLVGWGCFFPKTMLACFDKYIQTYGEDAHLLREADRIFTCLNQPFNVVIMSHEDLPQDPSRMSFESMHYSSADEAIAKAKLLLKK